MKHQSRMHRDRGAEIVEWGAAMLLLATIVAVLVGPTLPQSVQGNIAYAICRVFNGAAECESPADKKFKPEKCIVGISAQGVGATLDVAFVRVGKDLAFVQIKDNKGKVTVIAVNGTTLGLTAEAGVGVNAGNLINAGASVGADIGVRVGEGDAWEFNSQEEADQFIGDIQKKTVRDGVEDSIPVVGFLGREIADAVDPVDVPDPTITRTEVSLEGSASASAGLSVGPKEKNKGEGASSVSPNLSANVGIDASAKAIVEQNHKDGTTGVTVQVGGGANASGNYVIDGKRVTAEVQGRMKLTYNKDGQLSGLSLTRVVTTGGESTTTTTDVPITNEAERQAVYEQLGADLSGQNGIPAATPLKLTWDDFAPTNAPGPDGTALQQLLYDKGKTSRVNYAFDSSDRNYGASVALGLKLGANVNINSQDQRITSAEYLGAPGPGGQREFRNFDECHA